MRRNRILLGYFVAYITVLSLLIIGVNINSEYKNKADKEIKGVKLNATSLIETKSLEPDSIYKMYLYDE